MPTTVATPNDLTKLENKLVALITPLTAAIAAVNAKLVETDTKLLEISKRVTALEAAPAPDPVPDPDPDPLPDPVPDPVPPPTKPLFFEKKLIGGYKLKGEFARGTITTDFKNRVIYMTGHAQRNEVYKYAMPDNFGTADMATWPVLSPIEIIPGWWPSDKGYANGLFVDNDGELWAAPRVFYDMAPPPVTELYPRSNPTQPRVIPVPRQQFAGFMNSIDNTMEYIGGGGYESGQGSAFGPCLAKMDGTPLIYHDFSGTWDKRCPREPNYISEDGKDSWVCLNPRINPETGKLEGRWACDRLFGGGLLLDDGFYFFPLMAVGPVAYRVQSETFDVDGVMQNYVYRFDRNTYKLIDWTPFNDFGTSDAVSGQEIGPDGKIYLARRNAWRSGLYEVDTAVCVYG